MNTITFKLTDMAHGGDALGRHEGKVIFVPYAIPGETVRVEIINDKGRYAFARLLEVLEPSPDRVEPRCPYFGAGKCGGCQWQHIDYSAQVRLKANIVADQLERIGDLAAEDLAAVAIRPTLADENGWRYRNHAQLHPAPDGSLGFQRASGEGIITIDDCLVLHPRLSDLYDSLDLELDKLTRLTLRAGTATGDCMLVFEMEDDLPPALETDAPISCVILLSDGAFANLVGNNYITEVVAGHAYRISAPSFFQINTPQAAKLVQLAMEYLDLQGDDTVLDAYSGVGLFTTHLAERAGLVVSVEEAPSAVDDLLENTAEFDNVEIVEGAVEDALPDISVPLDAALLDPPRAGLDRFALDALVEHGPARIVYVSCDPATLARDTKRLTRAGYRLVEVQPVDMFPQTYHVESVALFVAG
jgi:23S rRNA (uracil1939-C5)-methyltransferase